MYNMQFGDSFLINDNGDGLLVDCGTIGKKIDQDVINQLVSDVTLINTKSILITHFHADHYNCFNQLPANSIDKVYMRNITRIPLRHLIYVCGCIFIILVLCSFTWK